MSSYKSIFFDLYNTLLFLERETWPLYQLMLEFGFNNVDEVKAARYVAMTKDFADVNELANYFNPDESIDISWFEHELSLDLSSARLFPETIDVLTELRGRGYRLGVISNLGSSFKQPFFNLGLDKLVDSYVFSCEVGHKKPEPEIYHYMLDKFGLNPQDALMVGDSLKSDYEGAKAVGMDALLLDRNNKYGLKERITSLDGIYGFID